MKKYAFTLKEDICEKNGKDVNATELLSVMSHYGVIEDYDKSTLQLRMEYQSSIDNLTAKLNAIKEQELTIDEIKMVRAYREGKSEVVAQYVAKADEYAKQLQQVKEENEKRTAQIKAILGE